MKVAQIVEELLKILGVINLAHYLLDGPQDVHAVPETLPNLPKLPPKSYLFRSSLALSS